MLLLFVVVVLDGNTIINTNISSRFPKTICAEGTLELQREDY